MEGSTQEGMEYREERQGGIPVDCIRISTEGAAQRLGRPCGEYITMRTGRLKGLTDPYQAGECLAIYLRRFLEEYAGTNILVAGIGNRDIVGDNLGPATIQRFNASILKILSEKPMFGQIGALAPGTCGQTNMETAGIIASVARAHDMSCVILIDSTVTNQFDRLVSSIQISNAGLCTHHNNARKCNVETIGAPVVTIGVPTVMDVSKLIKTDSESPGMVMLCGIERDVAVAAAIISYAIMRVSCPDVSREVIKLAQNI